MRPGRQAGRQAARAGRVIKRFHKSAGTYVGYFDCALGDAVSQEAVFGRTNFKVTQVPSSHIAQKIHSW